MIRLVPQWAYNYHEFWIAIKRRNLWFIQLRYLAVILLFVFFLLGETVLDFNLTITQLWAIFSTAGGILLANIIIHWVSRDVGTSAGQFNGLHLSLVQTLLDLIAVFLLVYFTGIIYSPFIIFFIFQLIIGSLILPGRVIYTLAGLVNILIGGLIFLQYTGYVGTHLIKGLFSSPSQQNFNLILLSVLTIMFINFSVVYLTNVIAHRLYQRERQLKETLDKLEETEIAKQKYIMGVVHELKSPVSAIQSLLQLVLGGFLGEIDNSVKEKLVRASKRADESIHIINNVLRISKIRLLNISQKEKLDIEELIQYQITKVMETAASKNIIINYSDERTDKKSLMSDRMLMELVISNILNNSIKYGHENGKIEVRTSDRGEGCLEIDLIDDGIGIPEEDQNKIFNQFFRSSNSRGSSTEGSGVGLSVVKEIIERLGGSIKVESPSEIGSSEFPGTKFTIQLCYGDEEEIEEEPSQSDLIIGREI